jgi:transcriptional regulator with XRE-family HTH domain
MTLRELADAAGVTESFLSQVEREVASPSIASVQRIAGALGLAIAELFVEEPSRSQVVARAERRRIEYPGLGAVDEFLTNGLSGRLQVIISTIAPGSIELWVGDDHHVLETGDAITYSSRVPHWNLNNGTAPAVVLFCVTPPSF